MKQFNTLGNTQKQTFKINNDIYEIDDSFKTVYNTLSFIDSIKTANVNQDTVLSTIDTVKQILINTLGNDQYNKLESTPGLTLEILAEIAGYVMELVITKSKSQPRA